jgi:FkbH-like protein
MNYFVFRNTTLEPFFSDKEYVFSQYNDILKIPSETKTFIWFYLLPYKTEKEILIEEIKLYYKSLLFIINKIPKNKDLLIFTLEDYLNKPVLTGDFELINAIQDFNYKITELVNTNMNVKIINFIDFTEQYVTEELIDWKYYYVSQMQLNIKIAQAFSNWFKDQLKAIQHKRKKCIIVDLDNTLWGGVLGEDGLHEIKIGNTYPGNAFLDFQKSLIKLTKGGVILAVCSKNNEEDVLEVWLKNTNNLITNQHISTYRINWKNKADNIKEIVKELNIGLDSVVFIDDNPAERELVKKLLPMVEVPKFPAQPYNLSKFIKNVTKQHFQIYNTTKEDQLKTSLYKANSARNNFASEFTDLTEYLTGLKIEIYIEQANTTNITRLAQMTQKTNQFNLTTKRYEASQIKDLIEDNFDVFCLGVKDKFGDNGITGLIILETDTNSASIDTLLLSCRILGKGIEDAFCCYVFNKLKKKQVETLYATFVPTLKNKQVESYYEKLGFNLVSESVKGEKLYKLDLLKVALTIKPYYKIID